MAKSLGRFPYTMVVTARDGVLMESGGRSLLNFGSTTTSRW